MMWQRVVDIHYPSTQEGFSFSADSSMGLELQDVVQHLGFDSQTPLFGMEDQAWLENVD